jgi:MFS family permease
MISVFAAPLGGWLSDRMNSRKPFLLVPYVILAFWMVFAFSASGWLITVAMLVFGILASLIPISIFAVVPEVMGKAQLVGLGMAALLLGQNLGQLLGSLIFGRLVEMIGWVNSAYCVTPIILIGIAASWFAEMG